ncbi:hypothetical protein DFJ43DRAFT_1044523 [Lentinula guzmanii]|uniref:Uncharacterized protein n=1 Tax=Lentinula guzmanii TaxID=2804957 RepID=A0AA38MU61_9AGAR|nr:hypothetical protein DFJ43DRAFT_1044523 [Lentinula guzmanii]
MAGIPMWESQLRPQTLPARVGFPPTFHIQTGLPSTVLHVGNPHCPIPCLESHLSWESQLSYTSPGNPNCPIPCLGIPLQLGIPTVLYLTWESHLNWESQLSYTLPGNPTSAGNPNCPIPHLESHLSWESQLSYTLPGNPTSAGNPNCPIPHLGIPTVLYLAWESHFSWNPNL